MNTWKRKALALLSVPLLAVPSAAGVYLWLVPHIGPFFAGLTAAGFESLYIGINVLIITTPELRRYARNVALSGVATAVIFNTLARYQAMVCPPLSAAEIARGIVSSCTLRTAPFDGIALGLAVLESIPLAGLAYAISVLLHRLSEEEARKTHAPPDALADAGTAYTAPTMHLGSAMYARPSVLEEAHFSPPESGEMQMTMVQSSHRACPNCGTPLDAKHYAAAKRWKRCGACKGT
jgi:ribosomal protein S27AE